MEGPQAPAHGPMGSSQGITFCFRPWFLESFLPFPRMTYLFSLVVWDGKGRDLRARGTEVASARVSTVAFRPLESR